MWTESERTAIVAMLRRGLPIAVIVHILLMNRLESQGALGWGKLRTYVASAGAAAAWMAVNNKEHRPITRVHCRVSTLARFRIFVHFPWHVTPPHSLGPFF